MQTMNISLPEPLKEFVDDQVGSGRYSDEHEYVRELIRQDQVRWAEEHVEALIKEGLESSEPSDFTADDWKRIRAEGMRQYLAKQGGTDL
ncbi:MAG: type II toxin-antitoxin system ParD family antitoxin [Bryobacteraceae bacterium]